MNNYYEIEVMDCVYDATEEICTEIFVKVNNIIVECFNVLRDKDFKVGGKYKAKLFLLAFDIKNNDLNKKSIKVESSYGYTCHCILYGKILSITPDSYSMIVDCGINVEVKIPKNYKPKINNYIEAEGRLDIKKDSSV